MSIYEKSTNRTRGVVRVTNLRAPKVGCAAGKWQWWRGGWGTG